tara:strand:+ start:952 stop:1254 length:303 start_codon:yes stop_codon:yes gene_type:complete
MSTLICNLPSIDVWVRREYLRDLQDGHGEFVKGVWVTAKSIPGRAFYFETYLPDYGALYDKLPISAFVSDPVTPIQIWIFTIFSFGIAWIMAWSLFVSSL